MDYSHGRSTISSLLNRPPQELRCLAPTNVPTTFFYNVNTFAAQIKILIKLFQASVESEATQNEYISVCQCCWYVTNAQLHYTLHLTLQPTDPYGFTIINGYELLAGHGSRAV
jgi:hypothetical protein